MTDPYQILGVSRDASDDEIKKAYRTLSRKYHPDANINNPNKDQAEAKFKEVQQAYQQIMKEREYGSSGSYGAGGYGTGGYGTYNGGGAAGARLYRAAVADKLPVCHPSEQESAGYLRRPARKGYLYPLFQAAAH